MKTKLLFLLLLASFSINAQTNLVPNGNFETWSVSTKPDNWYQYFSGYISKSADAQNGASSINMMVASGTFNFINTEYFPVTAGKTYRITMYHKLAKGTFSSVEFSLYHKPSTFKEEIIKKTDVTFSSTEWRKIEFEYTSTISENIEVDIWAYGSLNSEILVDNVSVVDVKDIPLQYTKIPDVEFEKKLIALGLDSGATDGRVLTSNIQTVKSLSLDTRVISDLTGIEDFTALETLSAKGTNYYYPTAESDGILKTLNVSKNINLISLDCSTNKLTSIDISANTKLNYLNCSGNKIASINLANNPNLGIANVDNNLISTIDISKNQALTSFSCAYTKITSFDAGKNPGLRLLNVNGNKLPSLDISNNSYLYTLYCEGNSFTSLNTSKNYNLITLSCIGTPITTLDLSNNVLLQTLDCSTTAITTLDLSKNLDLKSLSIEATQLTAIDVSANLKLESFSGRASKLKTLDLSKNTNLTRLFCHENAALSEVNLKNGNNTKINNQSFNLTNCPNLYCLQVDDVNYATQNWKQKDAYVNYTNAACSALAYTSIPDKEFEKRLIELGIDSGTPDGKVLTPRIAAVKSLKVDPTLVADLTGLEDFTALEVLECRNSCVVSTGGGCGKITTLDVSKNTALKQLYCEGNQLTSLNVSKNINLTSLYCSSNKLTSLDLSNNPELSVIDVSRNFLTELNISNNKKLSQVTCRSNKIKSLDVTNSKLTLLACSDNEISSLDLTNQSNLVQLYVENNKLSSLNTANKPSLIYFNCSNNLLTSLDVTSSINLSELKCSNNKLTSLNVTQNVNLTSLGCGTNAIAGFDISKNIKLKELECSSLQLKELDVTFLPELKKLTANKNNLTAINLSKNLKLTDAYLSENQIAEIDVTNNLLLAYLLIQSNKLKVLNVVNNPELYYVDFYNNQLTTFDISKNKKVQYVNCNTNKLTSLNLQNGVQNLYINIEIPNYKNNPDLKCIQVTDAKYSKTNWSYYADANVRFSEDCAGPLTLLPNNFTVEAKGELCPGENNGAINITAKETFAYQAKINDKVLSFTNNALNYSNLAPGNYTISITIPNEIFEQNFNVTIPKAAATAGKSSVTAKNVDVEITQGTAPFTVFVDGKEQFQTTDANFTVALDKAGLVEVATAKACEGVFAKKVTSYELGTMLAAYPNPTSGSIEIEIPNAKTEVLIELFNFGGQLVSKGNYNAESGRVLLNLEKLPAGIYAAKINLEIPEYIKIIKN
ncbi:T9SS type A sorting domain-containing protein [uncultured Flavobacterium sp.]|uniref:T9SS type A sorting domain-containing protein n=1 Tax=uncultured Flavobacterium sp. TaxID=165435 RepID=UPI0025FDF79B|nr:T9SS type A sorting domain-containing protein [uncultured Flavobacterium sp.]